MCRWPLAGPAKNDSKHLSLSNGPQAEPVMAFYYFNKKDKTDQTYDRRVGNISLLA